MLAGKKILFVHSSAELYGSDRCLAWMAAGLLERGMLVEAALPFHGPLEEQLGQMGVPVHTTDTLVFRRNIMHPAPLARFAAEAGQGIWRLRSLIYNNKYDLIHSNTGVVVGGALAAWFSGVPHIWHFREILSEFRQMWKLHEPLVTRTSKRIVCISGPVADQFKSLEAHRNTIVVHDGIPVSESSRGSQPGWNREAIRVLSIGRLASYKGQDVLIEAVRSLVDIGYDLELTFVGDVFGEQTDFRETLKRKVLELQMSSRVRFMGFCSDVRPFIEDADIFVLPSRRPEGLGLVVLEAMSQGTPVVATRGGGVTEIIEDRKNGILIEPGDAASMAAAIGALAKSPALAEKIGENGYRTVAERFSVTTMCENLAGVYNEVLEQS